MFLAIKEMLHEKLRYSLIVALIFLVSYLLIILTGLATGLANLNKAAINEWDASSIVLNSDSEGRLQQSFLSQDQVASLPNNGTRISQYSTLVKSENGFTLVGIVSYGDGCARPSKYGVYTKVNYFTFLTKTTGF